MKKIKAMEQKERKQRARSLSLLSKQISVVASLANQQRLQQPNLMDKMLLPPIKKVATESKIKKYEPKFQKPDLEELIRENTQLKKQIHQSSKAIGHLKVKIRELEAKNNEMKGNLASGSDRICISEKPNTSVYTIILKKKVEEMLLKLEEKESEIERLKKLPSTKIFQENCIEKQHLLLETIRLTAKVTALETKVEEQVELKAPKPSSPPSKNKTDSRSKGTYQKVSVQSNFHSNFIKILKEENEKLKGTIRLLENDKTMMKSSQSIQMKEISNMEKKYEQVCKVYSEKVKEIEVLTQQNKNLLFKKAEQFNFQCQEKERSQIYELVRQIQQLRGEKRKIDEENELLIEDNKHLKDKEKMKSMEIVQIEHKYEALKLEMAELESREGNQSHNEYKIKTQMGYNDLEYKNSQSIIHHKTIKSQKGSWLLDMKKSVKFSDITLPLLILSSLKKDKILQRYDEIFDFALQGKGIESLQQVSVTFQELQLILSSRPLMIPIESSLRLGSYIFEDHLEVIDNVPHVRLSIALTILKATLNHFSELLFSQEVIPNWKAFLQRRKKFYTEIEELEQQYISSEKFFEIVLNSRMTDITEGEILYIQLMGFSREKSVREVILSKQKLIACFRGMMGGGSPAVSSSDIAGSSPLNSKENSLFTSMGNIEKVDSKTSLMTNKKSWEPKVQNRHRLSLNWTPSADKEAAPSSKRFSQIYQLNHFSSLIKPPVDNSVIPSIAENSLNDQNSSEQSDYSSASIKESSQFSNKEVKE